MSKPVKKKRRGGAETRRAGDSIRVVAPSARRLVSPSPGRPVSASPQKSGFDKVFEKIYRLVMRIPRGRVMTYGQIARILEERYSPRLVGWAMHATPKDARNIPWHRVINSQGAISTGRVILTQPDVQRLLLEAEGVVFDARGHCDLSVYQWSPRQRATRAKLKALRAKTAPNRNRKTKPKER
jgi:methylated-DNA-protein-cysteine methyltransferase-like protein